MPFSLLIAQATASQVDNPWAWVSAAYLITYLSLAVFATWLFTRRRAARRRLERD